MKWESPASEARSLLLTSTTVTYMVCGVSYHDSPVEIREQVAIPPSRLQEALRFVADSPGVRECMVLSTCNRTELYLSAEEWLDGKDLFIRFARSLRGFDMNPVADQIHVLEGLRAVNHLFRVASSLDSLVLGEPQILGQTKAAFREAECSGCVGRDLHRWVPRAFSAAKQVRCETGICDAAVSVSYASVQLARKIYESLGGKRVVLIGAGKTAELSAVHLREAGAGSITVVNRTAAKAEDLAARIEGVAATFEQRYEEISRSDVVICSTDAQDYILDAGRLREALRGRSRRPLLILDISVPRNADPAISSLDGAYLFNIDDLESVVQANRNGRLAEAARAEDLLRRSLEKFAHEDSESLLGPEIAALRDRVRSICLGELERIEKRLPDLKPESRKDLELMLHRIAQKILHPAIMELKAADSRADETSRLDLVRKLFGVDRKATTLS